LVFTWDRTGTDAGLLAKLLTANNLTNAYARQGSYVNLTGALSGSGSNKFHKTWLVILEYESGTAPAASQSVTLYGAWSHDATSWPGGVTGVDAAYKDGEAAEWAAQLESLGSVTTTADGNTVQREAFTITAKAQYFAPVLYNGSGQAFRNNSTTHATKITMLPLIEADEG